MRNLKGQFNKGERNSIDTEFKKGKIPWNKGIKWLEMSGKNNNQFGKISPFRGKKHTKETVEKMRQKKLGKKRPDMIGNKFCLGWSHPNKGKKLSKEQKSKLVLSGLIKGRGWNKGIHASWVKGERNHNWKGGINPINDTIRKSLEYKLFVDSVFARDGYTCQKTKIRGGKLHAHHILNFAQHPELRFAIDNGVTLSKKAHQEFHKIYGRKNNTKEQLEEFLNK